MRKQLNATVILRWVVVFFFLLIWQWSGDSIVFGLRNGFDMGVQNIEMYTAISDDIAYGRDLMVGIYGPLGWMFKGVWLPLTGGWQNAVLQLVSLNVLSAGLRTFLIMQLWRQTKDSKDKVLAVIASACIFLRFPLASGAGLLNLFVLVTCVLLCQLNIEMIKPDCSQKTIVGYTAAIGILLAIPQLAKFSYFAMVLALGCILTVLLLVRKKFWSIAVLAGTYLSTTIVIWVLSGEKLQYLFSYFWGTMQFVGGYSEIFSWPFSYYHLVGSQNSIVSELLFAFVICITYGCTLIRLFFKDKVQCVSWFIIAPFLFLVFKEAFVRSDTGHVLSFRICVLYAICYLVYVLLAFSGAKENTSGTSHNTFLFNRYFWGAVSVLLLLPMIVEQDWLPKKNISSDISVLSSRDSYEEAVAASLEAAKMSGNDVLMEDVAAYPGKTFGILSGEQTFFITNGLMDRYRVNPVISLWDNASAACEARMADYYRSENAPDVLFYRQEILDSGYETARMGTILRSLLENYHVSKLNSENYLVMERNEVSTCETVEIGEPLTYTIGEEIQVPQVEDQFVFVKVDWDLTLLGRFASFVLKVPKTTIEIQTENGENQQYRFYRVLSTNGVYMSSLVENTHDLGQVMDGVTHDKAVEWISLWGDSLFYKDTFSVSFYGVPKTQAQREGTHNDLSE